MQAPRKLPRKPNFIGGKLGFEIYTKIVIEKYERLNCCFGLISGIKRIPVNAFPFKGSKKLSITALCVSPENSTVTVALKDRTVSVRDKGIGIIPEDLPYIFDRFYKVQSEANMNGTGLGLAISKQIADRHGIEIQVESQINEGTTFNFNFNQTN